MGNTEHILDVILSGYVSLKKQDPVVGKKKEDMNMIFNPITL